MRSLVAVERRWVEISASHPFSQRARKKDGAPFVILVSARPRADYV